MNAFDHPNNYKVLFAGCPLSDLIVPMHYKDEEYRGLYSADYIIGQSADQNVKAYRHHSPVWNSKKLIAAIS